MATDPTLRILLIGINYSPELTGIGPYTTGIAEHFAELGHRVRVLTGMPHYPEWRYHRVPSASMSNPSVNRYGHFVPRKAQAAGRMLYEGTWLVSASRGMVAPRPDIAIGVIPSLSGGVLAWMASRRFSVPLGLVFQDLMGLAADQSGYRGAKGVARITRALEAFLARRADVIGTVSPGFDGYLGELGVQRQRIVALRNWDTTSTVPESRQSTRSRLHWGSDDFVCLHAGNMGQKQGLDNLIDAAVALEDRSIKVVLAGDGNDRRRLVQRVSRLGLKNVHFLGLQSSNDFRSMLYAADALIVQQRRSVTDMALPSKLTSYFSSGRPVIAAVAQESATANEVEKAGGGLVVPPDNPVALADAVAVLKRDPQLARRLAYAGQLYARSQLTPHNALSRYDHFLTQLAAINRPRTFQSGVELPRSGASLRERPRT